MKVQVKRAREPLKIILFLVTKKEKNRLEPQYKCATAGASVPYFKINVPLFYCPLFQVTGKCK